MLEGKAPLQTIFALNEKARHAGASMGMTKLQVEACSDLGLRPRSLVQEAAAHAALLDCAQSFSPRVEDVGCDTVLLDLAGMEPLFGPLPKIAKNVARRASALGLETNVAVASNPDTAILAAHGFSGVIVIPEGREAEQLGNLPLEVLFTGGCDPQTLEVLERWGIRNFRALAALPEIALSERLGRRAFSCNSWRAAAAHDRWFRSNCRWFSKRQSSWNIPWCCWSRWRFCWPGYWTSYAPAWARAP